MKINLRTDAKRHNLALMKISTIHKELGDSTYLNGIGCFDKVYGSWLFEDSMKVVCHEEGGPAIDPAISLPGHIEKAKPDYDLYPNIDYSLGYTFLFCPRNCQFCIVPHQKNTRAHYSIFSFWNPDFNKICLLNNNTFADVDWKETFEEIWDAGLTVIDENGYDLRLMDEEKADALRKTKFKGRIHYAWDLMDDEYKVLKGLKIAPKGMVYVLIGFNTTEEENIYRCQKINDLKHDPYIMPFNSKSKTQRRFQRFINTRMYRKYKTISEAWEDYES
jgi:hypothetical protein